MKKTFIFYNDWEDYTDEMSLEEKGLFLQTILNYQNGKELGDIDKIKFVRSRIKKQLDENNISRQNEIELRRKAGKLGGLAKASKRKQVLAGASSGWQNVAVNVNVNNKEYIKELDFGFSEKVEDLIKEYNKQRKKKLENLTIKGKELFKQKLKNLGKTDEGMVAVLENSIINGYEGIFPVKSINNVDYSDMNVFHDFMLKDKSQDIVNAVGKEEYAKLKNEWKKTDLYFKM